MILLIFLMIFSVAISDLFIEKNTGIQTKNDAVTLRKTKGDIQDVVNDFLSMYIKSIEKKYAVKSGGTWTVANAKADLERNTYRFIPILFRPFDVRWTVLTD